MPSMTFTRASSVAGWRGAISQAAGRENHASKCRRACSLMPLVRCTECGGLYELSERNELELRTGRTVARCAEFHGLTSLGPPEAEQYDWSVAGHRPSTAPRHQETAESRRCERIVPGMPYAERDGLRLYYERDGQRRLELLFVPGWCCDHTFFAAAVRLLQAQRIRSRSRAPRLRPQRLTIRRLRHPDPCRRHRVVLCRGWHREAGRDRPQPRRDDRDRTRRTAPAHSRARSSPTIPAPSIPQT